LSTPNEVSIPVSDTPEPVPGAVPAAGDRLASPPGQQSRMVREFVFMTGSRYAGAVLGVLRGLVIPKLLDPALYGVFKSYQTVSELSRMATMGIPTALFRELPIARGNEKHERGRQLLDNGFWSTVLSAIPFALAFLIGGLAGWINLKDVPRSPWLLLFIPMLFVDRTKVLFDVIFTGQTQFVMQSKIRMIDEVSTTLICIGGVWLAGFPGLIVANLLVNILITALAWKGTGFQLRARIHPSLMREMVAIGFPQMVIGLCSTVYNQLDRMVILGGGLGLAAVGFYSVGMTITDQLVIGAQIVSRVIMPRMMEQYGKRENVRDIEHFVIPPARISGLAYAPVVVIAALAGEIVFSLFLTKYQPGFLPFQIMLVGTFFISIWAAVSPFFLAIRQQRKILVVFIFTIPVALGLNIGAIRLGLGLPGVAFATMLTDFGFASCVLLQALAQFIPTSGGRLLELGKIYLPISLAGVVYFIAQTVREFAGWADAPIKGPIFSFAIFAILFIVPAVAFAMSPRGRRYLGVHEL
jgi:O-antigen/teichoic acid export membrane protein